MSNYSPESSFSYPWAYSVETDAALILSRTVDGTPAQPHSRLVFNPVDALIRWSRSVPGQWQAGQTARYPTFHTDLPAYLIPSDNPHNFRVNLLKIMSFDSQESETDRPNIDFHPLGHMARVLAQFDTLIYDGPLINEEHDPYYLAAARHSAALHDIGETEFPGVILANGKAVGDIAAIIGKTEEDKRLELKIFTELLGELYGEDYTPEMQEIITKIVSHNTDGDDKQLARYGSFFELAHHINSARTGIRMGELAGSRNYFPREYVNFLTLLAEESWKFLSVKFEHLLEQSPELKESMGGYVEDILNMIYENAHSRDEDPEWLTWRLSDPVVEHYGEYCTS